jgi:hypothetical protein
MIINVKLLKMRKLIYLFVIMAGMTLAVNHANGQDPKCMSKEAKMACCKTGDKTVAGKCCKKETATCCKNKNVNQSCQKGNNNKGLCKPKDVSAASETKTATTPK